MSSRATHLGLRENLLLQARVVYYMKHNKLIYLLIYGQTYEQSAMGKADAYQWKSCLMTTQAHNTLQNSIGADVIIAPGGITDNALMYGTSHLAQHEY